MTTRVLNLQTLQEVSYTLPPLEALICAFAQYTERNWNTWEYDMYEVDVLEGEFIYTLGEWAVLKNQDHGREDGAREVASNEDQSRSL